MKKQRTIGLLLVVVLLCSALLTGCKNAEGPAVATVNGEPISQMLLKFHMDQVRAQMQSQQQEELTDEFWENTEIEGKKAIDHVREKALEECTKYMLVKQQVKEQGLKLEQNDKLVIEKQKNQTISNLGGKEEYKKALAEQGITDAFFQSFLETNYFAGKLQEKMVSHVDEAAAQDFFNNHIVRVKHILFLTQDEQGNAMPKEQADEVLKKAENALAKAKAGGNFDQMVADLSEDPGSASQPDGYYLGEGFILGSQGAMVTEFERASLALKAGEVSELVESNYGYHIIKRYENQQTVYEANKDEVLNRAKANAFQALIGEWKAAAKVVVNDAAYQAVK